MASFAKGFKALQDFLNSLHLNREKLVCVGPCQGNDTGGGNQFVDQGSWTL